MSYSQYVKHASNHHKDKHCQPCGFVMDGVNIKSLATVAEETATSYHVREVKTGNVVSDDFATTDEAVDFVRRLPSDVWYGIYTDKGFCLMK